MTETRGTYDVSIRPGACFFCEPLSSRIVWSSPLALGLWDGFPVSPGHALIVPRRHASTWDDLTPDEKTAIVSGIDEMRAIVREQHDPDAFNIGFNDGPAAGQTVMHFHIHIIPRYAGDVPDPRGGVRWVLPEKAAYWTDADP